MTTSKGREDGQNSVRGVKGGNSAETHTRLRERVQRNPVKEDGDHNNQSSQFGQATSLLQLRPLKPALPTADHNTLRPTTTLNSLSTIPIQAKLQVNEPNDAYEVEAEHVADQVMRMPVGDLSGWGRSTPTAPKLQLKCVACGSQEKTAMRSAQGMTPEVTPAIERNIQKMQGGGKPLNDTSRRFFEQRMGADFSNVRIHTDANAIQTSRDINARAFTTGNNIAFNSGEYNPDTAAGKHLLAHELTHTIQQVPDVQREASSPSPELKQAELGEINTARSRVKPTYFAPAYVLEASPLKNGQWYPLDRAFHPNNPQSTFWIASEFNVKNLNHQAYKTILQRHAFYRFADAYLTMNFPELKSRWYGAAAIVTGTDAVGSVEAYRSIAGLVSDTMVGEDAKEFLQTGNAFLFEHNMKNLKHLISGESIPGMENLKGKKLDYALVEFEQQKVTEFANSYEPKSGTIEEITTTINELFDAPGYSPANWFSSKEVSGVIDKEFSDKKLKFNFATYEHRVILGKGLIDKLHEKK